MNPREIKFILFTFAMTPRDLARALGVAPFTVSRWVRGTSKPTGLQEEVLRALHQAAHQHTTKDASERRATGKLLALGVGALILATLNTVPTRKPKKLRR